MTFVREDNERIFFTDLFLDGMSKLEYMVLHFSERCEHDFGLGPNAPYIRFERGNEELHLIATESAVVAPGRFGIYQPGRILKFQLDDGDGSGMKLMTTVKLVYEIPETFVVAMSAFGSRRRGSVSLGPNGDYLISCLLDNEQHIPGVEHIIKQNTLCEVSISRLVGVYDGIPTVLVRIRSFL